MSQLFGLSRWLSSPAGRRFRPLPAVILVLLAIEFIDELTFGVREAAWPQIRDDLSLTYVQIGLIFAIPGLVSGVLEVGIGILADIGHRQKLILAGGILYGAAMLVMALFPTFFVFLAATAVLYPASGAFVSLSQASLMDSNPSRREQNMARWTFAGSLGIVGGSIAVAAAAFVGVGWQPIFFAIGVASLVITIAVTRTGRVTSQAPGSGGESLSFISALRGALRHAKRSAVLRWIGLLGLSDLMLDVLLSFLALYFVDVVGASVAEAAIAVTVWTVVGLIGDFALIPLLERVRGVAYLRISTFLTIGVFAAFLIVPGLIPKMMLLGVLGFLNAGWYSVLQAGLYSEMPGRSGAVVSVTAVSGTVSSVLPLAVGVLAGAIGLEAALWFLIISPVGLFLALPRK